MNPHIDALRKAMRAARPTGSGQYIEEGRHELEVTLAKCNLTEISGKIKESYIIEFKVLSSTNPSHEVGSTRSYIENPENAGWDGRFKACILACAGLDPAGRLSTEDEEQAADVITALRYDEYREAMGLPEGFLVGRRVHCEGMRGQSRGGGPITKKKWLPLP